jgi:outer membrane lipoprotein SlyB
MDHWGLFGFFIGGFALAGLGGAAVIGGPLSVALVVTGTVAGSLKGMDDEEQIDEWANDPANADAYNEWYRNLVVHGA